MEYLLIILFAIGATVIFNPITWIVVIVAIILSNKSKKKKAANGVQASQNTNIAARPAVAPKPVNPMARWNWLLYIGSFLIVLAMMYFINTINDSYVAPSTIILTLLIYVGGIVLYKKIDYLRPVAKAFVYSALCMIPLWIIALSSIGIASEFVPICVSFIFMITSFASAFLLDDNLMGHIAFTSAVAFMWSFGPLMDLRIGTGPYYYLIVIPPMIAAILPASLYLTGIALPKAFKEAAKNIGISLWLVAFCASLALFFVPDIASVAPLLRTVCSLFFLLYSFVYWYKTKKHSFIILARIGIQTLIIALIADVVNASAGFVASGTNQTGRAICFITTWLLTFAAQVLYSLYCKKETKSVESSEHTISIVSMICIFWAPNLYLGLPQAETAIIWIIVCALLAIFGIAYASHYKNVSWSITTAASIMIIPFVIGNYIASPVWKGDSYLFSYMIVSLLFLLGTYFLQQIQKKETQIIGAISISISCFAIILAANSADLAYLGYMLAAAFFAGYALIANLNIFYEVAIYLLSIGLIYLVKVLLPDPSSHSYYYDNPNRLPRLIIDTHIIGIALIGAHLLAKYLYKKTNKVRLIVGYSLFSAIMTTTLTSYAVKSSDIGWALLFLVEQVVALLYSVAKKEKWLIWFSSIEIFIIALRLTDGLYFLWIGLIGVGLIAFVIWQLSKADKKLKGQGAPAVKLETSDGTVSPEASGPKDKTE